jgi:hypothetical protein
MQKPQGVINKPLLPIKTLGVRIKEYREKTKKLAFLLWTPLI